MNRNALLIPKFSDHLETNFYDTSPLSPEGPSTFSVLDSSTPKPYSTCKPRFERGTESSSSFRLHPVTDVWESGHRNHPPRHLELDASDPSQAGFFHHDTVHYPTFDLPWMMANMNFGAALNVEKPRSLLEPESFPQSYTELSSGYSSYDRSSNEQQGSPCIAPYRINFSSQKMKKASMLGSYGGEPGQFNYPHGFILGPHDDLVVADTKNHRIQVLDRDGCFKYSLGGKGKESGLFLFPRKVAIFPDSFRIIVADQGQHRSRLQIFSYEGIFQKEIRISYVGIVAGMRPCSEDSLYVVDSLKPILYNVSVQGRVQLKVNLAGHVQEPSDLALYGGQLYVSDYKGHCVVVLDAQGRFLRRVGDEGMLCYPNGLCLSPTGLIVVGDSHGNMFHVTIFSARGCFLKEFKCYNTRVSRCIGLVVTKQGGIVTLAKNNNFIIYLNNCLSVV